MKGLFPSVALLALFLALSSCGESNGGLTASEIAYVRAKRLQELYGTSGTATVTTSSVVTITAATTVATTVTATN